jgi:Rrf2 family protein
VRITAQVDYAVRACVELAAAAGNGPVKGDALARSQQIPFKFLENLLALLRRAGLVSSQRGSEGGYWLAVDPSTVSIADIIRAVEGPLADVRGQPPEDLAYEGTATALRDVWIATRANLRAVLETVSVADVAAGTLPDPVRELAADPESWTRRRLRP